MTADTNDTVQAGRRPILHFGRDRRFGAAGKPWQLGDGHRDDPYCKMLLALRGGEEPAVRYFFSLLDRELPTGISIAVVPCHIPGFQSQGLAGLGRALAGAGRTDATTCLVRTQQVPTLDEILERGFDMQRISIATSGPERLRGRAVILLDDIALTGHTIRACEEALYEAGAVSVQCVVLGRVDPALVLAGPKGPASSRPLAERPAVPDPRPSLAPSGPKRLVVLPPAPHLRKPAPKTAVSASSPSGPRRVAEDRHQPTHGPQPRGAGPDYGRMRKTTRPLIVDGAPGPNYWKMLKSFGATGDVD